jgi:hypothetical protein
MKSSLFVGCSYTNGTGFELEKQEPGLWVNLMHQNCDALQSTQLVNLGRKARSNAGIFQDAVAGILEHDAKYVFVAWTSYPRYELSTGLETYETLTLFSPGSKRHSITLNDITYTEDYLNNLNDRFTSLAHPHWEILNILRYINILVKLAATREDCQIFFINALCYWDENYFEKLTDVLPNFYTTYTQQLINVSNRDDKEIFKLYNKIHTEYQQAGGVHQEKWLNLYKSLRSQRIDVNANGIHPGINSNKLYSETLLDQLTQKL